MSVVVSLAKPNSASTAVLASTSGNEAVGVNQGSFRVKAAAIRWISENKEIEVTGDGDSVAAYDLNLIPSTQILISGWMLGDSALGLSNLASSSNNGTWKCQILVSSSRKLNALVMVRSCVVDWEVRSGVAVAVQLALRVTNTAHSDLESASPSWTPS